MYETATRTSIILQFRNIFFKLLLSFFIPTLCNFNLPWSVFKSRLVNIMVVHVSHVHTLVSSIFSAHELAMNAIMVYMITTVTDDRENPSLHEHTLLD